MNTWIEYCIALSTLKHCDLMAKYLEFKKKKKTCLGKKIKISLGFDPSWVPFVFHSIITSYCDHKFMIKRVI